MSLPPLPIDAVLPELLSALAQGPYAVLVAPPGAGKTTRVPLALLQAPWRGDARIIMLEPRRLAARAAAHRMAQSLGETIGQTVGYRVRMDTRISSKTRIEIVTEGVFTRLLLDDPELKGIAAVVFDEFHERSLDGDLGLALALDAAALRADLRVVVMSATIDGAAVARLLNDAPVIQSQGHAFPVETLYRAPDALARLEDQVVGAILAALRDFAGSALVFLPGQGEIIRVAERLAGRVPTNTIIAPLYGQLSQAGQDRAIRPPETGQRKVVLATSIAETSLTIEGVRIVIDAGFRRIPAYEPATGLTSLQTRRVSRAGADQRRGRAGRTAAGVCIRLWNQGQTAGLEPFDTPEILAADLAGFALDLAAWGVTEPSMLDFLDPPPRPAWSEAIGLLQNLDALDPKGHLTAKGKALARLPLHPRLAHMIVAAAMEDDAMIAAELAVLIGERGLGGESVDLATRLARFRTDHSPRANEARALAQRWAKLAGGGKTRNDFPGPHLARAYPDRIAQATGPRGRFRLANGRQASLDAGDALATEPFLVVTDMTGSAANGRIRGAAALERADLENLFADRIKEDVSISWNDKGDAVIARRRRIYAGLVLVDQPVPITDLAQAAALLAVRAVDAMAWSKAQKALLGRIAFLRAAGDDRFPDLTRIDPQELAPYLVGRTALAEIEPGDLDAYLAERLPFLLRAEIDHLLPSHFKAPSGSHLPIDYGAENGPVLEVRVQELFGLDRHPSIAGGKIALRLVLLSPAHRPIQTTRDLPGFWRGSWTDVVKALKGRYPRHFWPDDPVHAAPTARAKPRGT